jgi:hypothetical protein
MPRLLRAAVATALPLLAACGGDAPPADGEAAEALSDSAPLTVAGAPAAALDSARAAAARGETAAVAVGEAPPPAEGEPRVPPQRPPPDRPVTEEEARGYRLSMDRIRQLVRAGEELATLQARRPEMRDSMAVGSPDPNAILERLSNVAPAREAIARAGLTPREYTLATIALMQAGMVSEMRRRGMSPPIEVNEDNVRLVAENWEEIQRMMAAVAQRVAPPGQP